MSETLTSPGVLAHRLASLLLDPTARPDGRPSSVAEVVTWFGAMQSQDLASGLFSLGARLAGTRLAEIERALERGEALRTWPMRGTVHLVPPRDARWMLELMGARALAGAAKRRAHVGLSESDTERAIDVLGSALAGGGRLSRSECLAELEQAGIETSGQRGYHLLWYTSQRGVTCIAPNRHGEQTFVLLDEWAPDPVRLDRDEALATIAVRYFRSHGPTTRQDLAGWTGLPAADAKRGIAAAGDALESVSYEGREMLRATDSPAPGSSSAALPDHVLVLPGFDEYLLGYKDRSLMLDPDDLAAVVPGRNGVFRSTVVRAGRVVGTWKRRASRARVVVDVWPLASMSRREQGIVEEAFESYARFLDERVEIRWPTPA